MDFYFIFNGHSSANATVIEEKSSSSIFEELKVCYSEIFKGSSVDELLTKIN